MQRCIHLIKSESKDFSMANYVSNKCCSFELFIHQRNLKKKIKFFLIGNISQNCRFYCIFHQLNAALVADLFHTIDPKLLNVLYNINQVLKNVTVFLQSTNCI